MNSISEAEIIASQLREARNSLALSISDVALRAAIDAELIEKWEQGEAEPTTEQIWSLARVYKRSTDYFLRRTPEFRSRLSFRLSTQKRLEDLGEGTREALVRFDELCRAEYELEKILGKPSEITIERNTHEQSPSRLALLERQRLSLGDGPIRDMRATLEEAGIRLFMLPIGDRRVSGVSWWHGEYGPCILVNSYDQPRGRRTFTMAHEYAHLVRANLPTICDLASDDPDEAYANSFASHFLIPADDARVEFEAVVGVPGTIPDASQLGTIAGRYGTSLEATSRRFEILGLVPKGTTDLYIEEWSKKPPRFRPSKRPLWRRQLGEKFVSLAIEAQSDGRLSLGKFAKYLGLDVRKAADIVRPRPNSS